MPKNDISASGKGGRSSVRPFFRFEAFSCWNSIEFMSNFYGAGLQKAIERYHTKAYVLPNAAKEAPLQQRCFDFAPITGARRSFNAR